MAASVHKDFPRWKLPGHAGKTRKIRIPDLSRIKIAPYGREAS